MSEAMSPQPAKTASTPSTPFDASSSVTRSSQLPTAPKPLAHLLKTLLPPARAYLSSYYSGDFRKASHTPFDKINLHRMVQAIGRPRTRMERGAPAIFSPFTRNPSTFCSSALGVSEESNVQSVAVTVAALGAEAHKFCLSRGDMRFIGSFRHQENL